MSTSHFADPEEAQAFALKLLVEAGLPTDDAELMAKCLVLADVRGVVWHPLWHFCDFSTNTLKCI